MTRQSAISDRQVRNRENFRHPKIRAVYLLFSYQLPVYFEIQRVLSTRFHTLKVYAIFNMVYPSRFQRLSAPVGISPINPDHMPSRPHTSNLGAENIRI